MTIRKIVTPPAPVLREKAHKVRAFTSDLQSLIDDMIETMRQAPGVGLAAPQVGVSQRVIVVEYAEGGEDPDGPPRPKKLYAVVNPEITRHSDETVLGSEGCLSIPGYYGEVARYEWVTVKGYNRQGDAFRLKAKGWLARIFQHEVDHVDGVLFIDRATKVWEIEDEDHALEGAPSS
jgi:peptide deformylase